MLLPSAGALQTSTALTIAQQRALAVQARRLKSARAKILASPRINARAALKAVTSSQTAARVTVRPGPVVTPTVRAPTLAVPAALRVPSSSSSSSASSVSSAVALPVPVDRASATVIALRARIVDLVNAERAKAGLKALRLNTRLQASAQGHSDDMLARTYFSHEDPDGLHSVDRIRAAGYLQPPCPCSWSYVTGENIAKGQLTPEEVMKDWMDSPGHRDNILNASFEEIGVGITGTIWVQNFGVVKEQ